MFGWLTERRRRKLAEQPFPPEWEAILDEDVAIWRRIDDAAVRERLRDLIVVFLDEKRFEGCGGLELEDRHRVIIAALACVLLLGREHALYEDVESILVYPSTMVSPARTPGVFERGGVVDEAGTAILGEAHLRGPVILAWDDVLTGARGAGRRNVVFHELAHKIDMVDGTIDGTPPLSDRDARRDWATVCSKEYLELRERVDAGKRSFLDDYGATNEAEFFAVATEAYWCQPSKLRRAEPQLFEVLAAFYQFAPPE